MSIKLKTKQNEMKEEKNNNKLTLKATIKTSLFTAKLFTIFPIYHKNILFLYTI